VLLDNKPESAANKPAGGEVENKPAAKPKTGSSDAKYRVETRTIKIGSLRGKFRAIESGLKPDEKVVVSGLQRVKTGTLVNATLKPSTETPAEEVAFQLPAADLRQAQPAGQAIARDIRQPLR
jgi:hypothetical protein